MYWCLWNVPHLFAEHLNQTCKKIIKCTIRKHRSPGYVSSIQVQSSATDWLLGVCAEASVWKLVGGWSLFGYLCVASLRTVQTEWHVRFDTHAQRPSVGGTTTEPMCSRPHCGTSLLFGRQRMILTCVLSCFFADKRNISHQHHSNPCHKTSSEQNDGNRASQARRLLWTASPRMLSTVPVGISCQCGSFRWLPSGSRVEVETMLGVVWDATHVLQNTFVWANWKTEHMFPLNLCWS